MDPTAGDRRAQRITRRERRRVGSGSGIEGILEVRDEGLDLYVEEVVDVAILEAERAKRQKKLAHSVSFASGEIMYFL